MIVFEPHVAIVEFQPVRGPRSDVVAIALCEADGIRLEPLVVSVEPCGALAIRVGAWIEWDGGGQLDLRATFGGADIETVPELARGRLMQLVLDRTHQELDGGSA